MTDDGANLILEHLIRCQVLAERVERRLDEMTARLVNMATPHTSIMQHLSHLAAADPARQVAIDNIHMRLDRIERRLELTH